MPEISREIEYAVVLVAFGCVNTIKHSMPESIGKDGCGRVLCCCYNGVPHDPVICRPRVMADPRARSNVSHAPINGIIWSPGGAGIGAQHKDRETKIAAATDLSQNNIRLTD